MGLTKPMVLRSRPGPIVCALLIVACLFTVGRSAAEVSSRQVVMYLVPGVESGDIAVVCTIQSVGPCVLKPDEVAPQIHDIDGNPVHSSARFVSWPAAAQSDNSNGSVGFRLIQGDLPAGMYHAVVYVPQSLRSQTQPEQSTMALVFSIANPLRTTPSIRMGQDFIALPSQSGVNTKASVSGSGVPDEVSGADLGTIFTILRVDEQAGQLTLTDDRGQILTVKAPSDAASFQDLLPLADDTSLQRVRELYEGKLVWGRGGLRADCTISNNEGGGIEASGRLPFRIRRIVRVYGQASFNLGYDGPSNFDSDSSFVAMNPLIVLFDKPALANVRLSEQWSIGLPPKSAGLSRAAPLEPKRCNRFYAIKADVWDFERTYSTIAPEVEHPDWPANIIQAIYSHDVLPGMTHDMVAWSRGYPSFWGSIGYLDRLDAWKYPSAPPFHYWAYFTRGKLVKFGPDGSLP